jgi:hypothetical protein
MRTTKLSRCGVVNVTPIDNRRWRRLPNYATLGGGANTQERGVSDLVQEKSENNFHGQNPPVAVGNG